MTQADTSHTPLTLLSHSYYTPFTLLSISFYTSFTLLSHSSHFPITLLSDFFTLLLTPLHLFHYTYQIFAKDATYRPDNNRNSYPKGHLRHCWETYKHRDEFEEPWSEQETGARRAEIRYLTYLNRIMVSCKFPNLSIISCRTMGKALGKTYKGNIRAKAEGPMPRARRAASGFCGNAATFL